MPPAVRIRLVAPKAPLHSVPEVQQSLNMLKDAFEFILNDGDTRTLVYEELYRTAYNLVMKGEGELLYRLVSHAIRRSRRVPLKKRDHYKHMIRDISMFLEKVWCPRRGLPGALHMHSASL